MTVAISRYDCAESALQGELRPGGAQLWQGQGVCVRGQQAGRNLSWVGLPRTEGCEPMGGAGPRPERQH